MVGSATRTLIFFALGLTLMGCATPLPQALNVHALDEELTHMERRGMVAQVLVAQGGELLYGRGLGTRNPQTVEPTTLDTVFPLASLTKPFTAAAVLALAADGRIALDDALGMHLSGIAAPWADIPIESLMTHTSGVSPEIVNRDSPEPRFEPLERNRFIERVQQFRPRSPPGRTFRYSNVGYGLLGALIEAVSGEDWETYLRRRLLAPSSIEAIGFMLPGWSLDDIAIGRVDETPWGSYFDRPALDDGAGFNLRASGDLHAPASAILEWWSQLRLNAWLPGYWMNEWLQPRVREPDGSWYGYGWHFRDTPHGRVIGHTGGDRVYAVDFSWYRERDLLIYIATAEARFQADVIRDRLHVLLLGGRRASTRSGKRPVVHFVSRDRRGDGVPAARRAPVRHGMGVASIATTNGRKHHGES
jgi:CubicO group peptidase (beta-lactamase class C family)